MMRSLSARCAHRCTCVCRVAASVCVRVCLARVLMQSLACLSLSGQLTVVPGVSITRRVHVHAPRLRPTLEMMLE